MQDSAQVHPSTAATLGSPGLGGWLERVREDSQLTARGLRHIEDLREAHLEEAAVRTPPVGAFRRLRGRRVEVDG